MGASSNPLRFGVNLREDSFEDMLAICRAAEAAGFDTVSFSDRPPEPILEAWTAATAIGALTQRLILTHYTLNVPFRNPALTAKMAASLDAITGGRVELTLGAGAQEAHFRSYGLPFGSAGERVRGLRETIAIMRGMWAEESFSYQGQVYQVEDASVGVRPPRGTIPIWIGALGPRMMALTGRIADGWMKNRGWPASIEEVRGLVLLLETAAEKAGRDPATIRRALNGGARLGPRPTVGAAATAGGLFGPVDEILETIAAHRAAGIDTFHVRFPVREAVEQIEAFGREVLPQARAAG